MTPNDLPSDDYGSNCDQLYMRNRESAVSNQRHSDPKMVFLYQHMSLSRYYLEHLQRVSELALDTILTTVVVERVKMARLVC